MTTSEDGVYFPESQSTITEIGNELKLSSGSISAKPITYVEKSYTQPAADQSTLTIRKSTTGQPQYISPIFTHISSPVTENDLKVSENDYSKPAYETPIYINSTSFSTAEQYFGKTSKPITGVSSFQSSTTQTLDLSTEEPTPELTTRQSEYGTTTSLTDEAGYCAGFPCKHGGTCVIEESGYSCLCTSDFHGVHCELGN